MSTEHTNLPRSYPHVRVTGYEPPYSYHHMLITIHEPTRSWHNISRSKCKSIVQTTNQESKEQQYFRLALPTRCQAKLLQTVWRYLLTARHQRPQGHCFLVTAWRTSPCRQALSHTGTPDANPTAWRTYPCRQALYQQRNPSGFLLATQLV